MANGACVIKGGLPFSGQGITKGDILVGDGVVQQMGEDIPVPKVIDATGKYVFPGIVDAHCPDWYRLCVRTRLKSLASIPRKGHLRSVLMQI